ncbi:MAG TPA: hypothetical protein VL147_20755, partial [Devosia sp.]|nr:hypothetical protein [Devosia sp.]
GKAVDRPPYIPNLAVFDPGVTTRDYYSAEDAEGRRFWIYREGLHAADAAPVWYLHGVFP